MRSVIFRVNNYKDLALGLFFLCLLLLYSSIEEFSALVVIGLAAVSSFSMASYFCVRKVELTNYSIRFDPINVEIPLSEIVRIEGIDYPETKDYNPKANVIKLSTKASGFKWIPLNLLWIDKQVSIRVTGLNGSELHRALSKILRKP